MTGWQRYLVFAPSAAIGAVGLGWILVRDLGFSGMLAPERSAATVVVASVVVLVTTLAAAWALEKALPSFRYAGDLMERVLRRLRLSPAAVIAFAALTAVSEELFFRGALLQEFGLWPQAVLFGVLHPATRKGWSYPVFAFGAAVVLGWLTLFTGTLWAPIGVHFAINLYGMWEASRAKRRTPARAERADTSPDTPLPAASGDRAADDDSVQERADPLDGAR